MLQSLAASFWFKFLESAESWPWLWFWMWAHPTGDRRYRGSAKGCAIWETSRTRPRSRKGSSALDYDDGRCSALSDHGDHC
ncbi:hypothetical protein VTN00DRAFT_9159 [Thermoascus crustaceus]|uniref:uncharacterized protein n=1 Tax=Thermoascus crustaceus TaxID=5088 RepID=UPI00374424AC